jgi:DNA-binding response OmpR family regulator
VARKYPPRFRLNSSVGHPTRRRVARPGRFGRVRAPRHAFGGKDIWPGYGPVASVGGMGEAVLVVESEEPAREFLSRQLSDDGFEVFAADRAAAALALVEERRPDLVLLDAVLPDASGFEVCGLLRAGEPGHAWNRDVPVIMVSARGDPSDRVRGFARGADDYVIKPFVYDELLARMRAVLRRSARRQHPRLAVQNLEIDLASRVVRVGGAVVHLSAKEFDLLVALAEDPERVFHKDELLRDVWGFRSLR